MSIVEKARMGKSIMLNIVKGHGLEKSHRLNLPLQEYDRYDKDSPVCSPNSVFKLEMMMLPKVQEAFIEILSLFPLANSQRQLDTHDWDAGRACDDCVKKLRKYDFEDFVKRIKDTVSVKCKPHNGECVLMNNHAYVKMMEAIYTAYIIGISPTDIVMNLASGNTYWVNVWLANHCGKLYTNDNGFDIPIHDRDKQIYNYNEYQEGISEKIQYIDFDASKAFPYPDKMFDKIVSHSSVEHIDNWETNVLPEIIRTLKLGGKCGLASVYHPLGRENLGRGQSSWWTKRKWERFVKLQDTLGFEIIGNTNYIYGTPWRAEEDTDHYRVGGSIYIANFVFFKRNIA